MAITVDATLSTTSTNPVQNKAITLELNNKADSSSLPHGVPSGGTTGQVLVKSSNSDYAVEWQTITTPSGTKNISITSNGTETHDVTNYETASLSINVPNSYSASDEGKVVSNGSLVSQTSDTVTANDTYDTTLINSLTVNVSGGGDIDSIVDGSFAGTLETNVTSIRAYGLSNMPSLTKLSAPECTVIKTYGLSTCPGLVKLVLPKLQSFEANAVRSNVNLEAVDIYGGVTEKNIGNSAFNGNSKMDTLVIRASNVVLPLGNINAFNGTKYASGASGGTLYVPNSLISNYQSATTWSTILGYNTNSIKSIESTHTDPNAPIDLTLYYVDGTPIPT